MRRGVGAAVVLLIATSLGEYVTLAQAEDQTASSKEPHLLIFSGSDLWRHWAFAHGGILWSPAGLYNEGFTLKLLLNGGAYRYRSGALGDINVIGRQLAVAVQPGWRFKRAGFEVTVFAGLDLQNFRFTPDDPGSSLRGRYLGLRGGFELWHEPSATTMLAADASVSTIKAGNSARVAYGWRVFDRFYLGPEVQAFATDPYQQLRAGIHVTAFKTEEREWSGAIGWANDSDHRAGAYLRISVLVRR